MYKRKSVGKRILSALLVAVLVAPMLTGGAWKGMSEVQAATMPGNPRKGTDGVVTWDCVWFGRYPQASDSSSNLSAIKWRVLSVNGNDAFLIADCNLDSKGYNQKGVDVSWETSTMRSWLNGYDGTKNACNIDYSIKANFINTAFGAKEQQAIMVTTLDNPGNEFFPGKAVANAGNATSDRIFLLSYKEATNPAYGFAPVNPGDPVVKDKTDPTTKSVSGLDDGRIRKNNAYVASGGSGKKLNQKAAGHSAAWWLRSYGGALRYASYVGGDGNIIISGMEVEYASFAVCPALHIDLSNTAVWSFAGTVNSKGEATAGEAPPVIDNVVNDNKDDAYTTNKTDQTAEYKPAEGSNAEEYKVPDSYIDKSTGTIYKVTSIADGAFKNNKKIKKITIGDNVEKIGKDAFKGCTNLKTVVIGNNVIEIGNNAFSGCSKLESVKMGTKVTKIGSKAFYKCVKLKKIDIPSTVSKIGKEAFFGCKKLKTINISTYRLTKANVGSKAFKGIYSKAKIKVPINNFKAYRTLLKSKGVGSKAKIKK